MTFPFSQHRPAYDKYRAEKLKTGHGFMEQAVKTPFVLIISNANIYIP